MIAKKTTKKEKNNKLNLSKQVATNLSETLQLFNERFMACVKDVDTSNVEDIEFANDLIKQINELIDSISKNQNSTFKHLDFLKLTDEEGNPILEYKFWVVGEFYIEDDKPKYYKRRIVRARTQKEAIYKYNKVDNSLEASLTCFGEKDMTSDYSLNIENKEIID